MKKHFFSYVFSAILFLVAIHASAKIPPPQEGQKLPEFKISFPGETSYISYLGLKRSEPFSVSEIPAQIVIIEIFSMYCPYCQREAPKINDLYNKIQSNPNLRDRIKIIGIGAGNSPFEVNFFKKKFQVEFPLFPDQEFTIHKLLGEVRTPYFFVVRNQKDNLPLVIYSKLGGLEDINKFLEKVLDRASTR